MTGQGSGTGETEEQLAEALTQIESLQAAAADAEARAATADGEVTQCCSKTVRVNIYNGNRKTVKNIDKILVSRGFIYAYLIPVINDHDLRSFCAVIKRGS